MSETMTMIVDLLTGAVHAAPDRQGVREEQDETAAPGLWILRAHQSHTGDRDIRTHHTPVPGAGLPDRYVVGWNSSFVL